MANALKKLAGKTSVLVLMPKKDLSYDVAMRTADNLADTKVLLASYLNIRDLFSFDKIIMPLKSIDTLKAHLG